MFESSAASQPAQGSQSQVHKAHIGISNIHACLCMHACMHVCVYGYYIIYREYAYTTHVVLGNIAITLYFLGFLNAFVKGLKEKPVVGSKALRLGFRTRIHGLRV